MLASRHMLNLLRKGGSAPARSFANNAVNGHAVKIANALADASATGKILPHSKELEPTSLEEAYAIQRAVIAEMERRKFSLVGWKIGATQAAQQQRLGLTRPFYGPIFDRDVKPSPATVRSGGSFRIRGVECEYVFKMKQELKIGDHDFSSQEVLNAVSDIFPAVEVCGSRVASQGSTFLTVADQASHGRLIIAPHLRMNPDMWASFAKSMPQNPARLSINDAEVAVGDGTSVLGNPLTAVTWLANTLKDAGITLRENDLISSGTMTGLTPAKLGDFVVADFGGFGKVKVHLMPIPA